MPGLHRTTLDFEIIEGGNTKTLLLVDTSSYMEQPDRPLLEITLPGYDKYLLANYTAGEVNVFNSGTIGLNQVFSLDCLSDLPDGVWKIKQKICPYKYVYNTKHFLRVTTLMQKIAEIYRKIDQSDCQGKKDQQTEQTLVKISSLVEGGRLVADLDPRKAHDNYQLANRLVEKLFDKYCKNCN